MGFDKQIKNKKIFDHRQTNPPFPIDVEEELSSERIKLTIRLSSMRNIVAIRNSLHQALLDLEYEERGTDITVSGYPPDENFGEDNVLAAVKKYDSGAVKT